MRERAAEENGVFEELLTFGFSRADGVIYRISCVTREGLEGPFEFRSELYNGSDGDISYNAEPFFTLYAQKDGAAVVWQFKKESGFAEGIRIRDNGNPDNYFYSPGTGIYKTELTPNPIVSWVTTVQDFNSSGYIPMFYTEHDDMCDVFALEWSVGRVSAYEKDGCIGYSADLNAGGAGFETTVRQGETFSFPFVYFGSYKTDADGCSNIFKKWFFACKSPRVLRENKNEPLIQTDMQHSPEKAAALGIESLKWDYGWWSDDFIRSWKSLEGSWVCREHGYKKLLSESGGTMKAFSERMNASGLNWTVYVLLHDTHGQDGQPTDEYGEFNSVTHPEWFTGHRVDVGAGQSADLGNPRCVSYLKDALFTFFSENGIGTWRSDFEPIPRTSDKENTHRANGSDVQYRNTRGFEELVDSLIKNVPGFRYESCSSGGSMKDLFTATKAAVINCDDLSNYLGLRATFYDSSYCIPPAQLQLPCNPDTFCTDCKKHCYPVYDDSLCDTLKDMGMRSMLMGAVMLGSWCGGENDELHYGLDDYYKKYSRLYKEKLRPLIRNGELYHVLPRPDGVRWDGVMYADKKAENGVCGAIFAFRPSPDAPESVLIPVRGLDPGQLYTAVFTGGSRAPYKASGKDFMSSGIPLSFPNIGSELILFEK